MSEKKTYNMPRKESKAKKTVHKPDEERWNKSLGGEWVDITKVKFVNKPK